MLEIAELSVQYRRGRTSAIRDVSLRLESEKLIVVGANGSGKTTLIRAVLGLAPIRSGTVRVFGEDVRTVRGATSVSTNLADVYRLVSLPVRDLLPVFAHLKGVDLAPLLDRVREFEIEDALDKRIFELSTGQQKLVGDLLAVSRGSGLVLLDEPFDNVDFSRRRRLARLLQELPAEVLLSTHELELLRLFEGWRLAFMFEGRLFGPFPTAEIDRLYLARGRHPGALAVIETSVGTFSVTLDHGDIPVKSATSLNALVEAIA